MFNIFVPFIVLSFGVALFFTYVQPAGDVIEKLKSDIAVLQVAQEQTIQPIEIKVEELTQQNAQITDEDRKKIDRLVAKQKDFGIPNFINDMTGIVAKGGMTENGVKISGMTLEGANVSGDFDQQVSAGSYGEVYITFTVRGTYDEFLVLIKNLESSQRLFDVTRVSFQAPKSATEQVSYNIALTSYWRP